MLKLNSNQTVNDIIIWGINSFNNAKNTIKINDIEYECKYLNNSEDDFKCYEIRICKKKNLKPKFDMPPFVREIPIGNILNEKLCLTCTNEKLLLLQQIKNNIEGSYNGALLNERYDDEGGSFKKCVIY